MYFNRARLIDTNDVLDRYILHMGHSKYIPIYGLDLDMSLVDIDFERREVSPRTHTLYVSRSMDRYIHSFTKNQPYLSKSGSTVTGKGLFFYPMGDDVQISAMVCMKSSAVLSLYQDIVEEFMDTDIAKNCIDAGIDINNHRYLLSGMVHDLFNKISYRDAYCFTDGRFPNPAQTFSNNLYSNRVSTAEMEQLAFSYMEFKPFESFEQPKQILTDILTNHFRDIRFG